MSDSVREQIIEDTLRGSSWASLRAAFGKVLQQVEFTAISGVGHIAPLEAPQRTTEAIRSIAYRRG